MEDLELLELLVQKFRANQQLAKYGDKLAELINKVMLSQPRPRKPLSYAFLKNQKRNPNTKEIVQQGLIEMKIEPKV